jgi:hypothetical protein
MEAMADLVAAGRIRAVGSAIKPRAHALCYCDCAKPGDFGAHQRLTFASFDGSPRARGPDRRRNNNFVSPRRICCGWISGKILYNT